MENEKLSKIANNFCCDSCYYVTSNKYDFNKHVLTLKHINNNKKATLEIIGNTEVVSKIVSYCCSKCNYYTNNKTNYDKHLLTWKHKKSISIEKIKIKIICSNCNKEFNTPSGLWKHKKKCFVNNNEETELLENKIEYINDTNNTVFTPEMFMEVIKESKELRNVLVEQNKELQNKLLELASKPVSNTNNNTYNTNNNQFNLQFFLNETCKNAINIDDFVNSLQVQIADLEKTGRLGYVEGISSIFLRGLKGLDVTMRPIHCTDLKRETVFVKDENAWQKDDDEKAKLKLAIQRVARKNMRTLPKWQEENPDFRILDTKENDEYLKLALNLMGGQTDEQQEKYIEKIVRNVLREVVIEKKQFLYNS
jgi:hypothetical protein